MAEKTSTSRKTRIQKEENWRDEENNVQQHTNKLRKKNQ